MKREPIRMPVLSDTMKSGRLVGWQKQVGDPVHRGDLLAEVESDKAVMDLEAFADGYLGGPLADIGVDLPTGSVIGYLTDSPETAATVPEGGARPAPAEPAEAPSPAGGEPPVAAAGGDTAAPPSRSADADSAPPPLPHTAARSTTPPASPYARGLARELGVDLRRVHPGSDGVIRSRQVLAAALDGPVPDLDAGPPWRYKLFTPMHRAVADNMAATRHTPMFRVTAELPIAPLRQEAESRAVSLSLLLARAAALTVQRHPRFNMAYTPVGLAERDRVDVGIAVDVPGGLLTPVIHDCAARPLAELREEWRILKEKIERQRLAPADYRGATFYLSNMGVFPVVRSFEAIVPLGAAAILAVGALRDGGAAMTLSCDHRVVYGADAARFLETLGDLLSRPRDWLAEER